MISLDSYIIQFVAGNAITIALFLALLKGIAKLIPGVLDDKIITLLATILGLVPKPAQKNKAK
ncbi:MAG: hypothetical protein KKE05_05310 [Nanoarchaeota archaeon]|nr:hypothetical protein [Nanoarchaeota archaeon]